MINLAKKHSTQIGTTNTKLLKKKNKNQYYKKSNNLNKKILS